MCNNKSECNVSLEKCDISSFEMVMQPTDWERAFQAPGTNASEVIR